MDITIDYVKEKYKNHKFTLYHIKGKKWGCTLRYSERIKEQGYSLDDVYETKEIIGVEVADKLEKQLNLEYDYTYSDTQSYLNVLYRRIKATSDAWKRGVYNEIDFTPSKQTRKKLSKSAKEMWKNPERKEKMLKGTSHPRCKLTADDIRYIRKVHFKCINQNTKIPNGRFSTKQLAEQFNCGKWVISKIVKNKSYTSVK